MGPKHKKGDARGYTRTYIPGSSARWGSPQASSKVQCKFDLTPTRTPSFQGEKESRKETNRCRRETTKALHPHKKKTKSTAPNAHITGRGGETYFGCTHPTRYSEELPRHQQRLGTRVGVEAPLDASRRAHVQQDIMHRNRQACSRYGSRQLWTEMNKCSIEKKGNVSRKQTT